ncbi:2-dehydropantoate 2-reductase, partial [Halobacillus sp. BBL2006]|uniref:2-dehydropantoate 2-reductase n=1 Tax=Halobacillus sp. BBL2006 TaxID=1543706 RepID=UPI000541E204
MNIGIIGAGSIGILMAAYLGRDHKVDVYVRREEQKDKLNKLGVSCDAIDQPVSIQAHLLEQHNLGAHDLLIVTVKQNHIASILEKKLPDYTPLLFLQNGMGHVDQLLDHPNPVLVGVVEHGALKQNDNQVLHTGQGSVKIASVNSEDNLKAIINELNRKDFPFFYHTNYYEMLTSKLIVNAVINPLTGLFQVKNGMIVSNPHIKQIAKQVCREACQSLERSFEIDWKRVLTIAEATSENQSSMFKDLLEGKETEIDAISGYILQKSPVHLPYHEFLVQAIHALEKEREVNL